MTTPATAHKSQRRRASRSQGTPGVAIDDLHRMALTFADERWPDSRTLMRARKQAKARAGEILDASAPGPDGAQAALVLATADLFDTLRLELAAAPHKAARLVERFEELTGLSRLVLSREVLRAPELLALSPTVAVHTQLAMLTAFAPLRSVSLWTHEDPAQVHCVLHAGDGAPSRGAKALARCLLTGEDPEPGGARRLLFGTVVGSGSQPLAALIGSARPGAREECTTFFAQAVPVLAAVLERESLLTGNAASERALVGSSERKLTRLGFDLHDGPIQEVAVLAQDLRDLRSWLEPKLEDPDSRGRAGRELDEIGEGLITLDTALRRISNEVRSASVLLNRPFSDALEDVARSFAARSGITPRLTIRGDTGLLSGSQQIALLNIIQEALTNVREHSGATEVRIDFTAGQSIGVRVIDNGEGFELEPTLMSAARRGRLGLVAMHERVRLLGGQFRIDSQPGGPTVVSVDLERWEPLENGGPA